MNIKEREQLIKGTWDQLSALSGGDLNAQEVTRILKGAFDKAWSSSTPEDEVKNLYRGLALYLHPDKLKMKPELEKLQPFRVLDDLYKKGIANPPLYPAKFGQSIWDFCAVQWNNRLGISMKSLNNVYVALKVGSEMAIGIVAPFQLWFVGLWALNTGFDVFATLGKRLTNRLIDLCVDGGRQSAKYQEVSKAFWAKIRNIACIEVFNIKIGQCKAPMMADIKRCQQEAVESVMSLSDEDLAARIQSHSAAKLARALGEIDADMLSKGVHLLKATVKVLGQTIAQTPSAGKRLCWVLAALLIVPMTFLLTVALKASNVVFSVLLPNVAHAIVLAVTSVVSAPVILWSGVKHFVEYCKEKWAARKSSAASQAQPQPQPQFALSVSLNPSPAANAHCLPYVVGGPTFFPRPKPPQDMGGAPTLTLANQID